MVIKIKLYSKINIILKKDQLSDEDLLPVLDNTLSESEDESESGLNSISSYPEESVNSNLNSPIERK